MSSQFLFKLATSFSTIVGKSLNTCLTLIRQRISFAIQLGVALHVLNILSQVSFAWWYEVSEESNFVGVRIPSIYS